MPQPEHVRELARLAARFIRDTPDGVDWKELSNGEQVAAIDVPVTGIDGRARARVTLMVLLDPEANAEEMVMPLLRVARGLEG